MRSADHRGVHMLLLLVAAAAPVTYSAWDPGSVRQRRLSICYDLPGMSNPSLTRRRGYDWRACFISLAVAFAIAIPVGLITARLAQSGALMVAAITTVATITSRLVYTRVARRGFRADL